MGIASTLGFVVFLVGWIWLVVVSFKAGGVLWGILNILLQPLGGLIFCLVKKTGWQPFIIMLVGLVLGWGFGGAALMGR